jgi:lipopolysaccharide biosynthesis glycosyltransferase/glycosyltransferase involved in cell wall biosynthesis
METFWAQAFPEYSKIGHIIVDHFAPTSPPAVCAIARALAQRALEFESTQCTMFALLGDDVSISPKRDWLTSVRSGFSEISERLLVENGLNVPIGFGVVCLPDSTFVGFPSFPIVGRPHFGAFNNLLSPTAFVNQDADPFTYEVYRRFGAAIYARDVSIVNGIGGDEDNSARYERVLVDWKDGLLEEGVACISTYLSKENSSEIVAAAHVTTLDVIVPSFRTPEALLRRIIALPTPKDFSTQVIIIVDCPEDGAEVRSRFEADFRERVRVRVNKENIGASCTRNRGLDESSAQWIVFLDDDIEPHPSLLLEYASAIATKGATAAGFVGASYFPDSSESLLTTGLEMSYLTYFWKVASVEDGGDEAPWGVTANVCTRRTPERFDKRFPKTGGGEDIDYERRVARHTCLPLLKAPRAMAINPWWNDGLPSAWRFHNWALGDTLLMDADLYPTHVFLSWPNVWECSAATLVLGLGWSLQLSFSGSSRRNICVALIRLWNSMSALWLAEAALDVYNLTMADTSIASHCTGLKRVCAALVSCVYKNFNEAGHFAVTSLRRARPLFRFDWWFGLSGDYVPSTRSREQKRAVVLGAAGALGFALPAVYSILMTLLLFAVVSQVAWSFNFSTSSCSGNSIEDLVGTDALIDIIPDGLSVVYVCEGSYVHALAVSVLSLLEVHDNSVQCNIYVVDAGIEDTDWHKIELTAKLFSFARLTRIATPCPQNAPPHVAGKWSIWAKLWLDELLQTNDDNMVIYLDCDTLVLSSLVIQAHCVFASLRRNALPLAAVRDVGCPCGDDKLSKHGFTSTQPYFNAGVLFLDLEKIRDQRLLESTRQWALKHPGTPEFSMCEQDVLNLTFRGRWLPLSFSWNVQGMGTYGDFRTRAEGPSMPALFSPEEWAKIQEEALVVHFTRTSSPSLSQLLNPYSKIPTKPWAWFCHHPLLEKFWQVAARTSFKGTWIPNNISEGTAVEPDLSKLRQMIVEKHPSLSISWKNC